MTLHLISSLDPGDPFRHMAMEEYCFRSRHMPMPLVLIYINTSCVVIGRHQNGWQEANGPFLETHGIPVVRRITGGGTVYHDTGNLNIAAIQDFGRRGLAAADPWVEALAGILKNLGAPARHTPEHDIFLGEAKVSGHARYTNTRRLIAHSSLLVNSDLPRLRQALSTICHPHRSRAVASRPSPVTNVADHLATPHSMTTIANAVIAGIEHRFGATQELAFTRSDNAAIDALTETPFRSWQWTFGKTPGFEVDAITPGENAQPVRLAIEQGCVRRMAFENAALPANQRSALRKRWIGDRFGWHWRFPKVGA